MELEIQNFWLPKLGNTKDDYEDAFSPRCKGIIKGNSFSLSLSDGATESAFSKEWAKLLTRNFAKEPFFEIDSLKERVQQIASRWKEIVTRKPLPWYAEAKVSEGAFATFLGVQYLSSNSGSDKMGFWKSIAVGDTCLFQIRNDKLTCSFPISESKEFGNVPELLSTNWEYNQRNNIWERVKFYEGNWEKGDIFICATDAISKWFLYECEQGLTPWNDLLNITGETFWTWIDYLRDNSQLRNDDVTVVIIKCEG